jgi:hypothetical protein
MRNLNGLLEPLGAVWARFLALGAIPSYPRYQPPLNSQQKLAFDR